MKKNSKDTASATQITSLFISRSIQSATTGKAGGLEDVNRFSFFLFSWRILK
jgi:hypothetical protein